jgi:hypothetical protein
MRLRAVLWMLQFYGWPLISEFRFASLLYRMHLYAVSKAQKVVV